LSLERNKPVEMRLLVLLPLALGAPQVVWQRSTPDGVGTVSYFADDSYSVSVSGSVWLASSPTALHVNGSWYLSGNASLDDGNCTISYNVDFHGNDLTVGAADVGG
jgi:hypothetical protein